MRTSTFMKAASLLTLLFGVGHTMGMPWVGTVDSDQLARIETLASIKTVTQGFERSYWDYHMGFGISISIFFLIQALLLWWLGRWKEENVAEIRSVIVLFLLEYIAFALLDLRYFFWAPIIFSLVIAGCLAGAMAMSLRNAQARRSQPL